MNKWFAGLAFGMSVLALSSGAALAQGQDAAKTAAPAQRAQAAPNVQSVDILNMNQNQAERTRDQPGNLAPTWRIVKDGQAHYSSLPGAEMGVLIQPKAQFPGQDRATTAGEAWRQFRNGPLTTSGGWLLVLAVLGMVGVYLIFGTSKLKGAKTGRLIQRFTPIERIAHWVAAISFVTLAITGLTMLFGKFVLLPVFGHTLFGWLTYACNNIHNVVGPLFTVSIIVVLLIFVKDNLPQASDIKWLARLGGAVGKEHVSSGRFNAGEKLWFWGGVALLGLLISASGFVLDMLVPGIAYTRGNMQIAHIIHLVAAVLMTAASLGHIYMGTIGMEGSYAAMRTGYVDDTWARQHHAIWYDDIQSGKVPRVRTDEGVTTADVRAQSAMRGTPPVI
jgi:formate dehydrogenase subunit gamma